MSEITVLLQSLDQGDPRASEQLLPLVYDELRMLASARMRRDSAGHTLQPTALVHEAWLRLVSQGDRNWNNRTHFFRAAAQAMRHILVDISRKKASLKRGNRAERVDIDMFPVAESTADDRILLVNEALARLEIEDPESARLVTLKFFGGFTNQETAEILGLGERTVERQWAYAKASLYQIIEEARAPGPGPAPRPPASPAGSDSNAA